MFKIAACMSGESVYRIGDKVSIIQRWAFYKDKVCFEEGLCLAIEELYLEKEEEDFLPKFKVIAVTKRGKSIEVDIGDLSEVRSIKENREELIKAGYNFNSECIYSKGYESIEGKWEFFEIGAADFSRRLVTA